MTDAAQLDIFGGEAPGPLSLSDPAENAVAIARGAMDTATLAALRALPNSGTKRLAVLNAIAAAPEGVTDEELQLQLVMGHNTQTARRRELVLGGWVYDTGRRRPTPSTGSPAAVWALTPQARQVLDQRKATT